MAVSCPLRFSRIFQSVLRLRSSSLIAKTRCSEPSTVQVLDLRNFRCFCSGDDGSSIPHRNARMSGPKVYQKPTSIEIMLIYNDKVTKSTLEKAEKLAKAKHLRLIKVVDYDVKSQKPMYKLMSNLAYLEEEGKSKARKAKQKLSEFKEEKLITMSTKSGQHDIDSKTRNICKLLKRKHLIRLVIAQENNPERMEEIIESVKKEILEVGKVITVSKSAAGKRLNLQPIILEEPKPSVDDQNSTNKAEKSTVNQKEDSKELEKEKKNASA